jgi:hypothetical protein
MVFQWRRLHDREAITPRVIDNLIAQKKIRDDRRFINPGTSPLAWHANLQFVKAIPTQDAEDSMRSALYDTAATATSALRDNLPTSQQNTICAKTATAAITAFRPAGYAPSTPPADA